jgi:hypothetical protein
MAPAKRSKNIGDLIDHIERIREELLAIQRSLEEMERPNAPQASHKRANRESSLVPVG